MSTIYSFIDSVVDNIKTTFSDRLNTCVSLPGYLETTDLTVIHENTPGVFIAPVGSGEIVRVETGETDITLQMVAYLLVVNNNSLQREQIAQDLVSDLLHYIAMSGQRWGVVNAHPTTAVESADVHGLSKDFEPNVRDWRLGAAVLARAADLYGSTDPVSNLALWAITWEQMLRVGANAYDTTGEITPDDPQMPNAAGDGFEPVVNHQ